MGIRSAWRALWTPEKARQSRPEMYFSGVGGQAFGAYTYGPWGAGALGLTGGLLPGAKKDWARDVGHVWRNSVVSICLGWIADVINEAECEVCTEDDDGDAEEIADHPMVKLLRRPNHAYSGRTLMAATALSFKSDGNAYWIKSRGTAGYGMPVELWYVPHWQMFPQWPTGPTSVFIDHYKYVVDGKVTEIAPEDVVHFRDGIDPLFPRLGLGRLKALLRSLCSLNEAETYTASLLANMGVPSVAIIPDKEAYDIDEVTSEAIRERWQETVSGENRGRPFTPSLPVRIEKVGLSPEELALDRLYQIPMQMVCAALKVAPAVVGLEMGPSGFDSGGQRLEARRAAYEDCIMPMLSAIADDGLQTQLLPDFGDADRLKVRWCYDDVPALKEAEDAKAKRACDLFAGGIVRRDEARQMVGIESTGDRFGELFADGTGDDENPPPAPMLPGQDEPADTGDAEPDDTDPDEQAERETPAADED